MISEIAATTLSPASAGAGPGPTDTSSPETGASAFGALLGQSLDPASSSASDNAMNPVVSSGTPHRSSLARGAMAGHGVASHRLRHGATPLPKVACPDRIDPEGRDEATAKTESDPSGLAGLLQALGQRAPAPAPADPLDPAAGTASEGVAGDAAASRDTTRLDPTLVQDARAPSDPGTTRGPMEAAAQRLLIPPSTPSPRSASTTSPPSSNRSQADITPVVAREATPSDPMTPRSAAPTPSIVPEPSRATVMSAPTREILDSLAQQFAPRSGASSVSSELRQDRTSASRAQESLVATLAQLHPGEAREFRINPVIETVSVGTPVDHPDFPGALAGEVGSLVFKGLEKAEILVTPPDLGPIRIELSLTGDVASVNFFAASEETRRAIEQSIPTLDGLLSQQGLQLAQSSVDAGSGRAPGGEPRDSSGGPAFPSPTSSRSPSSGAGETTSPGTPRNRPSGLLDLFA